MLAFLGSLYLVVLRLLHIGGGVFWAGSAIFTAVFLTPAVRDAGPEGGSVMQGIMRRDLSKRLSIAAGLTFLSGLLLYLRHLRGGLLTASGLVLLLGVLLGTSGFVVGLLTGRIVSQIQALGKEIAAGGGPPSPEQGRQMGEYQAKMGEYGRITAILLFTAIICMAIWRYL